MQRSLTCSFLWGFVWEYMLLWPWKYSSIALSMARNKWLGDEHLHSCHFHPVAFQTPCEYNRVNVLDPPKQILWRPWRSQNTWVFGRFWRGLSKGSYHWAILSLWICRQHSSINRYYVVTVFSITEYGNSTSQILKAFRIFDRRHIGNQDVLKPSLELLASFLWGQPIASEHEKETPRFEVVADESKKIRLP